MRLSRIKQTQIKRLNWYKERGWSKQKLIKYKVFPKSFVDKYYAK